MSFLAGVLVGAVLTIAVLAWVGYRRRSSQ